MKINESVKINYYLPCLIINVGSIFFIVLCILAHFENKQEHYYVGSIIFSILLIFFDFIFYKIRKKMLCDFFMNDESIEILYFKKSLKKIAFTDVKMVFILNDMLYLCTDTKVELNKKNVNSFLYSTKTISFKVLYNMVNAIIEKTDVNEIYFIKSTVASINKKIYDEINMLGRKIIII